MKRGARREEISSADVFDSIDMLEQFHACPSNSLARNEVDVDFMRQQARGNRQEENGTIMLYLVGDV